MDKTLTDEQIALLMQYQREVWDRGDELDPEANFHWEGVCAGYLVGKGLDPEAAAELARIARYTYGIA